MPELIEVECYRLLAERALGRAVAEVSSPDSWILKAGTCAEDVAAALVGRHFIAARRIGKVLLLDVVGVADLDGGARNDSDGSRQWPTSWGNGSRSAVIGVRFGMTGRLVVDGVCAINDLIYSKDRKDAPWDRWSVRFADGGTMVLRDPRRLGGVTIGPDVSRLGPDAALVTAAQLRTALTGSDAALKARLMDQSRLAGLGNLLTDEILWRAGLDPLRGAGSLSAPERQRLHRHIQESVHDLSERGGSHTGDLMAERFTGGRCPRDGAELQRRSVSGRTTYSCPTHQR